MAFRILVNGVSCFGPIMVLAFASAGCDDSLLEPRTPEAVFLPQPTGTCARISERLPEPAAEDNFWQTVRPAPPPNHPPARYVMLGHTRSLGFIGDNPIGGFAPPPMPSPTPPPPYAADYGHAPPVPWTAYGHVGRGW